MDEKQTERSYHGVVRWIARIWSLPAIFFMVAHFFEPDDNNTGVGESLLTWITLGLLFVSVFGLVLAWWKAQPGGWMAIVALGLSLILYWVENGEFFPIEGVGMFLLGIGIPAILFLFSENKGQPAQLAV